MPIDKKLSYREACEKLRAQNLTPETYGLKGRMEAYKRWRKENPELAADLYAKPWEDYKADGFDWDEFIGTEGWLRTVAPMPYEELSCLLQAATDPVVLTKTDFNEWYKAVGRHIMGVSRDPEGVYKRHRGSFSWKHFLGTSTLSYSEARGKMRAQNLLRGGRSAKAVYEAWHQANRHSLARNLPQDPAEYFRGQTGIEVSQGGSAFWDDFMGPAYRSYDEAREIVLAQEPPIMTHEQYEVWWKENRDGVAAALPRNLYEGYGTVFGERGGWPGFVGRTQRWSPDQVGVLLQELTRLEQDFAGGISDAEMLLYLSEVGALPTLRKHLGGSKIEVLRDLRVNRGQGIAAGMAKSADKNDADVDQDSRPDILTTSDGSGALTNDGVDPHGVDNMVAALRMNPSEALLEYMVNRRVADLWQQVCATNSWDAVSGQIGPDQGGEYYHRIRDLFNKEADAVRGIQVPAGWSFTPDEGGPVSQPTIAQRRTAAAMLQRNRLLNTSGTGAGKTAGSVLAARVCGASRTLVVTKRDVFDTWTKTITGAYADNRVVTDVADMDPSVGHQFLLVNYEALQGERGLPLAKKLAAAAFDFVVFDEIHLVKQREASDKSQRRDNAEYLVKRLTRDNRRLRVLGLSATPVINNLAECQAILQLVHCPEPVAAPTENNLHNALKMHGEMLKRTIRFRPPHESSEDAMPAVTRNDLIGDVVAAGGSPSKIEQALLPAKLAMFRRADDPTAAAPDAITITPGTIVYTQFVTGMTDRTRERLEEMGFRVGMYDGPTPDRKREEEKRRFINGELDVLIASAPIATGVDGLQKRADHMVILSLPWTGAEHEQLIGRIRRPGTIFEHVRTTIPQVFFEIDGKRLSWDQERLRCISTKQTLSDAVLDGAVPTTLSINSQEFATNYGQQLSVLLETSRSGPNPVPEPPATGLAEMYTQMYEDLDRQAAEHEASGAKPAHSEPADQILYKQLSSLTPEELERLRFASRYREGEVQPKDETASGLQKDWVEHHEALEVRNRAVVLLAKEIHRVRGGGRMECECCGEDYSLDSIKARLPNFQGRGDNVDAHHRLPFSEDARRIRHVAPADFAIVCKSCHGLYHSGYHGRAVEDLHADLKRGGRCPCTPCLLDRLVATEAELVEHYGPTAPIEALASHLGVDSIRVEQLRRAAKHRGVKLQQLHLEGDPVTMLRARTQGALRAGLHGQTAAAPESTPLVTWDRASGIRHKVSKSTRISATGAERDAAVERQPAPLSVRP
jgi:superfamily II DNA or RNA helicase